MVSFNTLKIRTQIASISALALAFLLIVSGVAFMSLSNLNTARHYQEKTTQASETTQALRYMFLNARRNEKDFLIRLDTKYIDKHAKSMETAYSNLNDLKNSYAGNEAVTAKIGTIENGTKLYEQQFANVADEWIKLGLDEKEGLQGALRNSVKTAESYLAQFNQDALTVKMLMMRRHEKDFIMRVDPKYIKSLDDRVKEFNVLLAQSEIEPQAQQEIKKLITAYQKDFHAYAKSRLLLDDEIAKLSAIFADFDPVIEEISGIVAQDFAESLTKSSDIAAHTQTTLLLSIVIASILLITIGYLVGQKISVPIQKLTDIMSALAAGDRELDIPGTEMKNELGSMSRAVLVFKDGMIENERMAAEREKAQTAQIQRAQNLADMAQTFQEHVEQTLGSFSASVEQMKGAANTMTNSVHSMDERTASVAAASEETSANAQSIATAADELAQSISEIAQQVNQAQSVSGKAVEQANTTSATMNQLTSASQRIGEVVAIISDIAEQTNLLALNATIESARAGEAGKGFAVVASEVKALANQTTQATEQISEQISAIQNITKKAVDDIAGITKTIGNVSEISTIISAAVEEQLASTKEIASNVDQASQGSQDVSRNISDVSMLAKESGESAKSVENSTETLATESTKLSDYIHRFLRDIQDNQNNAA